jgi:hypothetical protein
MKTRYTFHNWNRTQGNLGRHTYRGLAALSVEAEISQAAGNGKSG